MTSNFLKYKVPCFSLLLFLFHFAYSQSETSEWKMNISFGVNSPIDNMKSDAFEFKSMNFPTINLGIQHMFSREWGAKLDYGWSRSANDGDSEDFKLNYSRINAQAVYDFTRIMSFLPRRTAFFGHAGPGLTFSKPLGTFSDNTYTYLNLLAGFEAHYGIARTVSVYADFSYVLGLSGDDKYDPAVDGFSFNGNLWYVAVGVSVSLSGCYFCENE